jgi:hypothetical protein
MVAKLLVWILSSFVVRERRILDKASSALGEPFPMELSTLLNGLSEGNNAFDATFAMETLELWGNEPNLWASIDFSPNGHNEEFGWSNGMLRLFTSIYRAFSLFGLHFYGLFQVELSSPADGDFSCQEHLLDH